MIRRDFIKCTTVVILGATATFLRDFGLPVRSIADDFLVTLKEVRYVGSGATYTTLEFSNYVTNELMRLNQN